MFQRLKEIVGESAVQLDIISPYFVPTSAGVEALSGFVRRGVKVRVLTNALEATDVGVVHAGYAKRRRALLENGIELYELRRLSSDSVSTRSIGQSGSSGSSLHAKMVSVDRSRIFIGSYNFDPRSASLNTEMGLVIESPTLAQTIEAAVSARVPSTTYQVRLTKTGELYWVEHREGGSVQHDTEPGTNAWQRARLWSLSLLPVEWLL